MDLDACADEEEVGIEDSDEVDRAGVCEESSQPQSPDVPRAAAVRASEDDGEEEGRRAKVAPLPSQPSLEERRRHEVTHLPFRSWCRHCMLGRCKTLPHATQDHGDESVATVSMDYCFLTADDESRPQDHSVCVVPDEAGVVSDDPTVARGYIRPQPFF